MNLLSLIPAPWRVIATIGLIAAILGSAYNLGYTRAKKATTASYEAAKVQAVQRAIAQAQEIAKQDAEIVRNNVQTVEVIRNRTRTIRIKEKSHATASPLPAECVLDDARMRLINDALANKDASTPKPD